MKKEIASTKVRIDKTNLVKSIIYKLEDADDISEPTMYFTLNALRVYTAETIWHKWDQIMSEPEQDDFSLMEIIESDENLFAYLERWNYKVTRITYQDVK
jgi:hypothetical protein